jgi:hypothetical protein
MRLKFAQLRRKISSTHFTLASMGALESSSGFCVNCGSFTAFQARVIEEELLLYTGQLTYLLSPKVQPSVCIQFKLSL